MSATAIMCLPTISSSLSYRVFEEVMTGVPLLAWWAQRVAAMPGVKNVVVLVRSEVESARLLRLVDTSAARIYTCQHNSLVRCLATYAAECGEPRVAVVRLVLPLGPQRLFERACAHHAELGNEVTEVVGLPTGLGPVIFEAQVLSILAGLRVPLAPTDPLQAYQCVRSVGAKAAADIGLTGMSIPFDGGEVYRRANAVLPSAVQIAGAEDVETCRRVLARVGDTTRDDAIALETWREEQRRDSAHQSRARAQRVCPALPARGQRPRVLYVSNPSATTGAERSLMQMIGGIDRRRFDQYALVAIEGLFTEGLRSQGVRVMCPRVGFANGSADDFLFVCEVMRLLNPSIVHLNSLSGSAVIAAAAERATPIICHTRNRPGHEYSEAFSYSAAVVAVSRYIKTEIMKFGVPEDRIHVIHNGVDTDEFCRQRFDRKSIRAALGIGEDAKMILMVSRLTPYKRHDLMISALPLIRSAVPSARVFALGEAFGEEEYVQDLKDRIGGLGLHDFFSFLPFQRDVRRLYVAADALILCSDGEPLARTVIEALAMETPVVITDSGGTNEIVRHNETALIARSGSAQSIAECLIKTLIDIEGCLDRTRAGRAFAEAHLSARVAAERMMQIYASVL